MRNQAAPKAAGGDGWEALMRAAQDGDGAAYARLLREILPLLRLIARRRLANAADAEDAVQDTLMSLHRLRHAYDPARPLRPWIAAICERRCVDLARRAQRLRGAQPLDALAELLAEPGAAEAALRQVAATELREAVAALPQVQRLAIQLGKLQDRPLAEVGTLCGRAEGAMKVATHRALRSLRARLSPLPA